MNILMLNYEYPPLGGGGGVVSQRIAENLAKNKDKIVIVTSKFTNLKSYEKKKNIKIYRLPVLRKKRGSARLFEMFLYVVLAHFFLFYIRLKYSFDSVNVHFAIPTGALIPLVKTLFRSPISLVLHGGDLPGEIRPRFTKYYPLFRPFIKLNLFLANNLIVVNSETTKLLRKVTSKKPTLIPNGADTEKFRPFKTTKKFDIVFMGRLVYMKSPLLAIESFAELKKKLPKATMLVIGDGELFEETTTLAKTLSVDKDITFKQWVDNDKLPKLINQCKVYWSIQQDENFGSLALFEVLACGVPAVVSDVGESKKSFKDHVVIAKLDAKSIAKASEKLLKNPKQLSLYKKRARAIAEENSITKMCSTYRKVFSKRF